MSSSERRGPVHAIERIVRRLSWGPPRRSPRLRPEIYEPAERARLPRRRLALAIALAVVAPAASAAALIPVRVSHAQTIGIVLVVPVVAVALLGSVGPAVVAALSASIAYDFFLTAPYQRLVIHDPDDVVTAVTLGAVGLATGIVSSRLARLAMRDAARRSELRHLIDYVRAATGRPSEDELVDEACTSLGTLLNLRGCDWRPDYHGDVGPVLLPDGNVMGYVSSLNDNRAILPDNLEIPAIADDVELGRFVLTPRRDHVASYEERLTAATIVSVFANAPRNR